MASFPASSNKQEEQFLQARQARSVASSSDRQQRHKTVDELFEFWSVLRQKLSSWEERLISLSTRYGNADPEQKQQGQVIRQELDMFLQELDRLRKHCLATNCYFDDWQVPELPTSDLRILHAEFTQRYLLLENSRSSLIPKERFIFRRYREAMAKRSRQNRDDSDITAETTGIVERKENPSSEAEGHILLENDDGSTLKDFSNCAITIDVSGNVKIERQNAKEADEGCTPGKSYQGSSLLIYNVENCIITVHKALKAVHLFRTSHTKIQMSEPVQGSVHVTASHHLNLVVTSQQLRIHESADLECYVDLIATAAILEDSTRVLFYTPSTNNNDRQCEVKDFNWLRTGIPSPNFCIERWVPPRTSVVTSKNSATEPTIPQKQSRDASTSNTDGTAVLDSCQSIKESIGESGNSRSGRNDNVDDEEDDDEL